MSNVQVRAVTRADREQWLRMRDALWPDSVPPHAVEIDRFFDGKLRNPATVLIAEFDGRPCGFAELSIRDYAEGCASDNVGYLEGLYVESASRRNGVARALGR